MARNLINKDCYLLLLSHRHYKLGASLCFVQKIRLKVPLLERYIVDRGIIAFPMNNGTQIDLSEPVSIHRDIDFLGQLRPLQYDVALGTCLVLANRRKRGELLSCRHYQRSLPRKSSQENIDLLHRIDLCE